MSECEGVFLIIGSSYCGSTLLNAILNTHTRIAGGGELHWLATQDTGGVCAFCGPQCSIWTPEARRSVNEHNLYDRVSDVFAKPFVADASKMPVWYDEFLHNQSRVKMLRILLTKHPYRAVSSFLEKARRFDHMKNYASLEFTLAHLRYIYKYALDHLRVDMTVRYEDLVREPERILSSLLTCFDLEFEREMLDWELAEHHYIGGNAGPRSQIARHVQPVGEFLVKKYARSGIFVDDTYAEILTAEEVSQIQNNADAQYLFNMFGYTEDI